MTTYYNEIDPDAVAIIHELIADNVIAPGDVDTRSIKDVRPADLAGYTQCHFFAGGGLWSVAARLAGWPDDRPLWTGSCPCQPFSAAGKGGGTDDPRHLWPDFHRLIRACRPAVVMGEQVAGKAGYGWLDGVRADLASEGYASRGVDIPACSVDAPHQRNRLYWIAVADATLQRQRSGREEPRANARGWEFLARPRSRGDADDCHAGPLVNGSRVGWGEGRAEYELRGGRNAAPGTDAPGDVADLRGSGRDWWQEEPQRIAVGRDAAQRPNGSFWADAEWIVCHDGKARRTKPGLSLLVDGLPGRVGLWRVAGNAISPVLAAETIKAFLDAEADDLRLGVFG